MIKILEELKTIAHEIKSLPKELREETINNFQYKFQIKEFTFVSDDDQANIDDWALVLPWTGEVVYVYEIRRGHISYQRNLLESFGWGDGPLLGKKKNAHIFLDWVNKQFFVCRFFINLRRHRRVVAEFDKMMLLR